jgi:hypothetical protein
MREPDYVRHHYETTEINTGDFCDPAIIICIDSVLVENILDITVADFSRMKYSGSLEEQKT